MVTAYVVSAFTANGAGGNKAGVVLNADGLSTDAMQAIAKELGYSETAFVCKSKDATYKVRFFTISEEVDLCGHATIAAWWLLWHKGFIKTGMYSQETGAGKLGIVVSGDGSVFMQQAEPQFLNQVSAKDIMPVLGIDEAAFEPTLQPQIVSTGLKDLLVPIRSKEVLMNVRPDFSAMIDISKRHGIAGLHVFALDKVYTAVARNFAPLVGIDEESATGTSNGALLCYLQENSRLNPQDVYRIRQGESMGQPSDIVGRFIDGRIWIGGTAVLLGERTIRD